MHLLSTACRTLLGVGFLATASTTYVHAQCQLQWQPGAAQSATNGPVFAVVADTANSLTYAGGVFSVAGSSFASSVAAWDGQSWQPLGLGVQGSVNTMLLLPNGDLIVGGAIDQAGSQLVSNIARWDGASWSSLGAGLDGPVSAIKSLPNGDLVVGGSFTGSGPQALERLAVWNGTTWLPYGGPGLTGNVFDLELLSNGDLAVAGALLVNGQSGLQVVVTWDGTTWNSLPVSGFVYDIAELPNGDLAIAAGTLSTSGASGRFGVWDGSSVQIETTPMTSIVRAITLDDSGELIGVGSAGNQPGMVARRSSSGVWTTLLNEVGNAFAVDATNGQVVVGIAAANLNRSLPSVMQFDGSSWQPAGTAPNAFVRAFGAGPANGLYAGGQFAEIEGVPANNVAYWNGSTWQAMGAGVDGEILELASMPNGDVIAVGRFANAGGAPANRIARWNGANWSTLGSGPLSTVTGDLATGPAGEVVLVTSAGIEVYQSGQWSLLPAPGPFAWIGDCEVLPNGEIVVAGSFNPNPGVVRWDGAAWQPVGTASASRKLAVGSNGDLYRAHWQGPGGGVERFDGTAWQIVGGTFNGDIDTITVLPGERIVATGEFTTVASQPIARAAIWDGVAWSQIDGGLSSSFAGNRTYDATTSGAGEFWLASDFSVAGGEISPRLMRAISTCPASATTFGAGCVGSAGPVSLASDSQPWIGTKVRATAAGFPSGSLAVQVVGTSLVTTPLPGPGCTLFVDPILVDAMVPVAGLAKPSFDLPDDPNLAGLSLRAQVVGLELDASLSLQLITSSNAIDYTIGSF